MELKSLTTYKSAFSLVQLILIAVILASAGANVMIWKMFSEKIEQLSSVIYIMDGSGSVEPASQTPINLEQRTFEYEDHVKDFYRLWYAFDEHNFEENLEKGLYLVGECGISLFDTYKEDRVLEKLQEKNLSLFVSVEEISINTETRPVSGYIKGTQTIKRLAGKMTRRMDCTFTLHNVSRSRENPHGVKIENWEIVNNSKVE